MAVVLPGVAASGEVSVSATWGGVSGGHGGQKASFLTAGMPGDASAVGRASQDAVAVLAWPCPAPAPTAPASHPASPSAGVPTPCNKVQYPLSNLSLRRHELRGSERKIDSSWHRGYSDPAG